MEVRELVNLRNRWTRARIGAPVGGMVADDVGSGSVGAEEFGEVCGSLEAAIGNPDELAKVLRRVFAECVGCVRVMVVEGDVFHGIVEELVQRPTVDLVSAIAELITSTQSLARCALVKEPRIVEAVLGIIGDQHLFHVGMKFLRKLVHNSVWTRCLLVASGAYECLHAFALRHGPTKYLLKTIKYAVVRDPVHGFGGYASAGGSLMPRHEVLQIFKGMIKEPKTILRVSNYLNYGCTQRIVKPIWLILRMHLTVRDVNVVRETLEILMRLAEYTEGMADDVVNMAEFQRIARSELVLKEPNAEIAAALLDVFSAVVIASDGKHLKFMKKVLQYRRLVKWISSGPLRLKQASVVFLSHICHLVSDSELSDMVLSRKNIFSLAYVVRVIDEFDFSMKKDLLLLIINFLSARSPEKRYVIYEHCFMPLVFDCLAASIEDLAEPVLRTLLIGLCEFPDLISPALMADENREVLTTLALEPDSRSAQICQQILSSLDKLFSGDYDQLTFSI